MTQRHRHPFNKRFAIEVGLEAAKAKFVARAHNRIFDELYWKHRESCGAQILCAACDAMGRRVNYNRSLTGLVGDSFEDTLVAIEGVYAVARRWRWEGEVEDAIDYLLQLSEIDLGIRWEPPQFMPAGAPELDETLIDDNLLWLRDKALESVFEPFQKGLQHLLHSHNRPPLRSDVVTDMYEALEALAKITTGRNADLSKNAELFITRVKASEDYKLLMKDYIKYANRFRHAAHGGQPKPELSERETESFVYLTGLFIRLAKP